MGAFENQTTNTKEKSNMTKNTLIKTALVAGLVLTPAVIGRYGAPFADLLRADVLIGFGMVATLVALITLEYGRRTTVATRALNSLRLARAGKANATILAFPTPAKDERAAA
jgi:protein-S-isoprenylcysteine O-methyltransferase Ste14